MMTVTRIDVNTGKEYMLDLTFVSNTIASVCDWTVYQDGTQTSHHYIITKKLFGRHFWKKVIDIKVRLLME